MFSLGGVTIITSVARTVAVAVIANTTQVVVWSVLETGVGIIVACCPALRVLLRKAGDSLSTQRSRSGHELHVSRTMLNTPPKRDTRDMEVLPDTDEFPLVKVTNGKEIIKKIDFEISVEKTSQKKENKGQEVPW